MSPAEVFPPELVRVTLTRVTLSPTLFRQSTGCSARRGLWGTLGWWPDRLRGNGGGEGRGPAGPLYPSATAQPCNSRLGQRGAKKRGRIGPWGRHRCSLLQPIAPACKAGDVSRRYSLPLRPFANVGVAGSSPVSCSRKRKRPRPVGSGAFSVGVNAREVLRRSIRRSLNR